MVLEEVEDEITAISNEWANANYYPIKDKSWELAKADIRNATDLMFNFLTNLVVMAIHDMCTINNFPKDEMTENMCDLIRQKVKTAKVIKSHDNHKSSNTTHH